MYEVKSLVASSSARLTKYITESRDDGADVNECRDKLAVCLDGLEREYQNMM